MTEDVLENHCADIVKSNLEGFGKIGTIVQTNNDQIESEVKIDSDSESLDVKYISSKRTDGIKSVAFVFERNQITIVPIGDLHIGSPMSYYQEIFKYGKTHYNIEGLYYVLLGDMLDNALKDSVGDIHDQTCSPTNQKQIFAELIKTLGPHKILGVVEGNHEERTKKISGTSLLKDSCEYNDIPFSETILVLSMALGKKYSSNILNYCVVLSHGCGGGTTLGGKAATMSKLPNIIANQDVYITGHTHESIQTKQTRYLYSIEYKKLMKQDYYQVSVGSWMGFERYQQKFLMKPQACSYTEIILNGRSTKGVSRNKHITIAVQ